MKFFAVLSCSVLCLMRTGFAQEKRVDGQEFQSLRQEVMQLRHDLDSLRLSRQDTSASSTDDEMDQLETRLEQRLQDLENKIDAVSRASAPVVLNPRMTAFINFAGRVDDKPVIDASGTSEISNRMFVRSAEMDLRNAVDPYAEAVAIITLENQAGAGFGVDAEEAYGLIKRLPLLETSPLGMKLKIGRFRVPFGVNNKIHMHDLPWTTRPLIVSRYLGTEHGEFFEGGYNGTGLDFDFFLPNPIPQSTLEMNLDLLRAGEVGLGSDVRVKQPAYVGHVTLSRDWSNEHLLLLGASTYQEAGDISSQLYGVDLTYKWAPAENRESHSFVAGGEFITGTSKRIDSLGRGSSFSPYGWFAYGQYQTSYWLYLGMRYDWLKEPRPSLPVTRSISAYASYYTTEFLRFRIGYEHHMSEIPALDNTNTAILDVNFVFGSHPTEPYWVNR